MGVLWLGRLWGVLFGSSKYKACIIGLDNAGKTTILYKLHLGEVVSTQPTIGSNVEMVQHKNVKIVCWDLGGQESLRASWAPYFHDSHALILVVDSSDRARIHVVREELNRCLDLETLSRAAVLVFANKQDVDTAFSPAELSAALDLVSIRKQSWHIQGCCALTGEGLVEGLNWLVEQLQSTSASKN